MQGTTFTDSHLVLLDDEPMHLITVAGLDNWRETGQAFEIAYDVVDEAPEGMLRYRCRYRMLDQPQFYVLVDPQENDEIEIIVLTGWREVQDHQNSYGDDRIALLNANGSVQLV